MRKKERIKEPNIHAAHTVHFPIIPRKTNLCHFLCNFKEHFLKYYNKAFKSPHL